MHYGHNEHRCDKATLDRFLTDGLGLYDYDGLKFKFGRNRKHRGNKWADYRKLLLVLPPSIMRWLIEFYAQVQSKVCCVKAGEDGRLIAFYMELRYVYDKVGFGRSEFKHDVPVKSNGLTAQLQTCLHNMGVTNEVMLCVLNMNKRVWDTLPMYMCNQVPHYPDRVKSRAHSTMIGSWMKSKAAESKAVQRRLAEYYLNSTSLTIDKDARSVILNLI
jgi:hypothetical protein